MFKIMPNFFKKMENFKKKKKTLSFECFKKRVLTGF